MVLSQRDIALILGIVIPTTIFAVIITVICIRRWSRYSSFHNSGYCPVDHALDDEEIQFKRRNEVELGSLQNNMNKIDDDTLFANDSDTDELVFDMKDLDRLSMLEKYRNNLVASTGILSSNESNVSSLTTSSSFTNINRESKQEVDEELRI